VIVDLGLGCEEDVGINQPWPRLQTVHWYHSSQGCTTDYHNNVFDVFHD